MKSLLLDAISMSRCGGRGSTSRFREGLNSRDQVCVVTDTKPSHCVRSHVIPHSLVRVGPSKFCANSL